MHTILPLWSAPQLSDTLFPEWRIKALIVVKVHCSKTLPECSGA